MTLLTISLEHSDQFISIDSPQLALDDLKSLIKDEFGIDQNIQLSLNGTELTDTLTLQDNDFLLVKQARPQQPPPQQDEQNDHDEQEQKRILEEINQFNIQENLQRALESTPEVFAPVTMLYINLQVNGIPIKAFVDTGAQATIINSKTAKLCNIERLIDTRFQGEAHGAGKGKILGKIHSVPIKISDQFLPTSFLVLDTHVDVLIGLDLLKRYQGVVDLKRNLLVLNGIEVGFLPESEIPNDLFKQISQPQVSVSSQPQQSSATQQPVTQQPPTFNESDVTDLINLGFSRSEVIQALTLAKNNKEIAASILFQ